MKSEVIAGPSRAILYLTQQCNMRCQHCWVGAAPDAPAASLADAVPDTAELLRALKSLGVEHIGLTGGEPFLFRGFVHRLVQQCTRLGLPVGIETNGSLLSKRDICLLRKHRVYVSISLDTLNERSFDDFRGMEGAFRRVWRSLQRLTENRVNTQVICSVTPGNVDEVADFASHMLDRRNVSSLKFNVVTQVGRGKDVVADSAECVRIIQVVARVCRDYQTAYLGKISTNIPMALVDDPMLAHTCDYKRLIGVLPDGALSFCGIGIRFPALVAGHLDDDVEEVWRYAAVFGGIREISPDRVTGVCANCIFGRVCCNHCPAAAYENYGDFYHSHPWCQMFHEIGLFPEKFLIDPMTPVPHCPTPSRLP